MWYSDDGAVTGHLCRAIGSWVSGNWDQPGLQEGTHAETLAAQAGTLVRRGGDPLCMIVASLEACRFHDIRACGSWRKAADLLGDELVCAGAPLPSGLLDAAAKQLSCDGALRMPATVGRGADTLRPDRARKNAARRAVRRAIVRRKLPVKASEAVLARVAFSVLPSIEAAVRGIKAARATLGSERWLNALAERIEPVALSSREVRPARASPIVGGGFGGRSRVSSGGGASAGDSAEGTLGACEPALVKNIVMRALRLLLGPEVGNSQLAGIAIAARLLTSEQVRERGALPAGDWLASPAWAGINPTERSWHERAGASVLSVAA